MEELFRQLEIKNEWFQKFLTVTDSFSLRLQQNPDEAVQDIDYFLNNRQSLLNIIESNEKKITRHIALHKLQPSAFNKEDSAKINAIMKKRSEILGEIKNLDEKILRMMNKIRKDSQEQLKLVNRGQRAIAGYRQDNDTPALDVQR